MAAPLPASERPPALASAMIDWSIAKPELERLHGTMPIAAVAARLGTTAGAIRGAITRFGLAKKQDYPRELLNELRTIYANAGELGFLGLEGLAKRWGKDAGNLSRKASQMGLTTGRNRAKVAIRAFPKPRMFATTADLTAAKSARMKQLWKERPHPRGALGMRHSEETKRLIAEQSRAREAALSEDQKLQRRIKAERTRRANGIGAPKVRRGKWYAGWRQVGNQRIYCRSRWEANYARYLEWLRSIGEIAGWQHEPHTFWFEGIKRGAVSYLPDFKVANCNGTHEWHEVKGWMDARSATVLKRMAKYYPSEKVVVIREKQYREIRRKVAGMIPDWEDEAKRKDWANWEATA